MGWADGTVGGSAWTRCTGCTPSGSRRAVEMVCPCPVGKAPAAGGCAAGWMAPCTEIASPCREKFPAGGCTTGWVAVPEGWAGGTAARGAVATPVLATTGAEVELPRGSFCCCRWDARSGESWRSTRETGAGRCNRPGRGSERGAGSASPSAGSIWPSGTRVEREGWRGAATEEVAEGSVRRCAASTLPTVGRCGRDMGAVGWRRLSEGVTADAAETAGCCAGVGAGEGAFPEVCGRAEGRSAPCPRTEPGECPVVG